jgi:predicted  nucleic acid-binding Zn-ribbon protein
LNPQLQSLLKVQRLDGRLELLRRELENRPKMHSAKQERLEDIIGKRQEILELQKEIQIRIDRIELEGKSIDDKVADNQVKLGNATSNAEYQGFQAQIARYQSEREEVDEQLLEIWDEMEQAKALEKQADAAIAEQSSIVAEEKVELEKELESIREEARGIWAERDRARTEVPAELIEEYDGLFARYANRSIVPVDAGICGGCNMAINPQTRANLQGDGLVHCNNCRRLLYSG